MRAERHNREGRWAWRLTGAITLCVYIFMFATRKRGNFLS